MAIGVARGGLANFQFCFDQLIPFWINVSDERRRD
jgi:hypothetical protein